MFRGPGSGRGGPNNGGGGPPGFAGNFNNGPNWNGPAGGPSQMGGPPNMMQNSGGPNAPQFNGPPGMMGPPGMVHGNGNTPGGFAPGMGNTMVRVNLLLLNVSAHFANIQETYLTSGILLK